MTKNSIVSSKILMLSTSYPLRESSCCGIFVWSLAQALKRYAEVSVICPADEFISTESTAHPVNYAPRPWRNQFNTDGGAVSSIRITKGFFASLLFISMLLKSWRLSRGCKIVIGHWSFCGIIAGLSGRLRGIPSVVYYRGSDINGVQHSILLRLLFRTSFALCSHRVFVSESLRSVIRQRYPDCYNNSSVILNGTSTHFRVDRLSCDDLPRPFRFLAVSSLIAIKRIDVLIKACANLKQINNQFHLIIIGDGPMRQELISLRDKLDLAEFVEFAGAIPPENVVEYYKSSHAFIHTSAAEGRSGVLAEAIMSGLPIICPEVPGCAEFVVHDDNGLKFEKNDYAAIWQSMAAIMSDLRMYNKLLAGTKNRRDNLVVTWSNSADTLAELLQWKMDMAEP